MKYLEQPVKGGHSRNVVCPTCGGNIKALFYYNKTGAATKARNMFYCDNEEKVFRILFEQVAQLGGEKK
jgi:hypothetical protein